MNSTEQPSVIVTASNQIPPEIPPNNIFQKKTFLLIGIIILVLVIGVGGYLLVKRVFFPATLKVQTNPELIPPNAQLSPTLYVSSTSINQLQTTPQTMNWRTLASTSCYLKIQYPDGWNSDIKEGKYGCAIKIEHPTIKSAYFLLSSLQNTTWDQVIAENKNAQNTTLAGVDGLITSPMTDPSVSIYGFYFHKGNSIFNGVYIVESAYPDLKNTFEEIMNTIQLTGKLSDYQSNIGEGLQGALNQAKDYAVKNDIKELQNAIENYQRQYNTFPQSLQILVDTYFIRMIRINPYTNLPYEYNTDSQTYSISGKLHDGTIYKLP